jgi:hypothetical protein
VQSKDCNTVGLIVIPSAIMIAGMRVEEQCFLAYFIGNKFIADNKMVSVRLIDNASSLSLLLFFIVLALVECISIVNDGILLKLLPCFSLILIITNHNVSN